MQLAKVFGTPTTAGLQSYLAELYPRHIMTSVPRLPLEDEAHVTAWMRYVDEGLVKGVWPVLRERLPQLRFPVRQGMSQDERYRAATLRGVFIDYDHHILLEKPTHLRLLIHQSFAGKIPAIYTTHRPDFISLIQALTKRNEPFPIPDSMGACMVAGYNNWDRIHTYQRQWQAKHLSLDAATWTQAFQQLLLRKELYQDRFLILTCGAYSGVSAQSLSLTHDQWLRTSFEIRINHECAHYFTKRLYGLMRNHLFDELIADYAGIVAAAGRYHADWFLHFMGLESFPQYREGGRLQNYINNQFLIEEEHLHIQHSLIVAARNLEIFDARQEPCRGDLRRQALRLLAITHFSLADLTLPDAPDRLCYTLSQLESNAGGKAHDN